MQESWLRTVDEHLGDQIARRDLEVVGAGSGQMGYDHVDLRGYGVRIRIYNDRGYYEVAFAGLLEPSEWFDSSEVATYLHAQPSHLTSRAAAHTAALLATFLDAYGRAIEQMFSHDSYSQVRPALFEIRSRANNRLAPARVRGRA